MPCVTRQVKTVCLCFLTGDIIFNANYPELPPDFIFGEDVGFIPDPSELPVSIVEQLSQYVLDKNIG